MNACHQCDNTSWANQPYGDIDARWYDGKLFCCQGCEEDYREELHEGFRLRIQVLLGPWLQPWTRLSGRLGLGPVMLMWTRPVRGNPRFEFCLNVQCVGLSVNLRLQ